MFCNKINLKFDSWQVVVGRSCLVNILRNGRTEHALQCNVIPAASAIGEGEDVMKFL